MLHEPSNSVIDSLPRLRWACRRGMLELDVLLNNFLEECYPNVTDEQKRQFTTLLTYQDPDIFAWLMGHERPSDQAMATITDAIRLHAQSRFQA